MAGENLKQAARQRRMEPQSSTPPHHCWCNSSLATRGRNALLGDLHDRLEDSGTVGGVKLLCMQDENDIPPWPGGGGCMECCATSAWFWIFYGAQSSWHSRGQHSLAPSRKVQVNTRLSTSCFWILQWLPTALHPTRPTRQCSEMRLLLRLHGCGPTSHGPTMPEE